MKKKLRKIVKYGCVTIIIMSIILLVLYFKKNSYYSCIPLRKNSENTEFFCVYNKGDKFMLVDSQFSDIYQFKNFGTNVSIWGHCSLTDLNYDEKFIQEEGIEEKQGFIIFKAISNGYTEVIAKDDKYCLGTKKFRILIK